MSRRSDHRALERLRTRTATWEDRQDEALAGLLALARSADLLAPLPAAPAPPMRRSLPALAGLLTTAVAASAFLAVGLTTGTGARGPAPATTLSSDAAVVSRLLEQVRADLAQAGTSSSAATRRALLARAAATLTTAEQQTARLPAPERGPLRATSTQLHQELGARRDAEPTSAQPTPSAPAPATRTSPAPSSAPRPGGPGPQPYASPGATQPSPPPQQQPPPPDGQQPPPH